MSQISTISPPSTVAMEPIRHSNFHTRKCRCLTGSSDPVDSFDSSETTMGYEWNFVSLQITIHLIQITIHLKRDWVIMISNSIFSPLMIRFGLSVHFKIFPVIVGIPCLLAINTSYMVRQTSCNMFDSRPSLQNDRVPISRRIVRMVTSLSAAQWTFGIMSLITFFSLAVAFYFMSVFEYIRLDQNIDGN